ncbi:hypothetical protein MRX96_024052 [Rhipicephalus microplus]
MAAYDTEMPAMTLREEVRAAPLGARNSSVQNSVKEKRVRLDCLFFRLSSSGENPWRESSAALLHDSNREPRGVLLIAATLFTAQYHFLALSSRANCHCQPLHFSRQHFL